MIKKNPGAAFTLGSPVNGGRGGTRTHDLTDVNRALLIGINFYLLGQVGAKIELAAYKNN